MFDRRFQEQVAIITGGASGLGKAITRRLAFEGARTVIFDMNEPLMAEAITEMSAAGITVTSRTVDVTSEQPVQDGIAAVVAAHGRLDIVVNCAGIVGPNGIKVSDVTASEFDEVIRVNLRGSFLITKHAVAAMAPQNYGRILLVASIAGKEGNAGMAAYSASKAGVIGLVKAVGKEFAETGITVNALAPAVIRTPMVDAMAPAQVTYMTDKIPMKRCGSLDEVTALACWIVSREASFTTGFTFDLSGGRATY